MLFFYGIWMLCHHGQSPKKGEKSKQRFLGYNEKTHFPFVKSARKPRNVSFLTQNPRFLRIVGYPAAWAKGEWKMAECRRDSRVNYFASFNLTRVFESHNELFRFNCPFYEAGYFPFVLNCKEQQLWKQGSFKLHV